MIDVSLIILIVSLAVALVGVGVWIFQLLSRKAIYDPSPGKGSNTMGILYVFTLGMLPWKKESARLHPLVYLRGIFFHIGILAGIVVIILSIFNVTSFNILNTVLGILMWIGVISAVAAIITRAIDRKLRALSNTDDYISPALITIFMLSGALYIMGLPVTLFFYLATSILCLYLPWSKVRHSVHFLFARGKIGVFMGHRGLLTLQADHSKKEIR